MQLHNQTSGYPQTNLQGHTKKKNYHEKKSYYQLIQNAT